ncbi:plasmid pRiA4b ORF-3 family protein [Solwaraspora sp. WMMD406]|uniref:plasmid pRiA4b ORF-3 family protein n=1 Tax=Solwaraspora sp. WMMD406 TaxID=3016095 RepID=UPI002416086F|nr:plasmid pRiA4b ORF-3 family protein [Solwaraspora sp. WMMD406]MDG4766965.1 plasmid pRiA4b ORF-3 family protein [Solwaraspora sp. WMMD406]
MPRQIFRLKVTLTDVTPSVWRRLLVPGGYTLDRVHRVIQHAMGWHDCHLHSFEIDGAQYGVPDPDGELLLRDELDVRLDVVAGKGARLRYTYDFGDWWEHDVVVEDVSLAEPDVRYPLCLDGAGGCPPEDVGGAYGYAEFLAAVADPAHPRHADMIAWAGPRFDPHTFDPARVTTLLRRFA